MKRALLLAGIPLALIVMIVAGWAVDSRSQGGEALRNVAVGGRVVGGLDRAELNDAIDEIASDYAAAEVVIHTAEGDLETTAAELGLTVDVEATVQRALEKGREDALPLRPVRWLTSLISRREAGIVARAERDKVRFVVARDDPTGRMPAVEPGIVGDDGQVSVVLGEDGEGLDADDVAAAIDAAAASGDLPIEVEVEPGTLRPQFSRADAEKLVEQAKELTSSPLTVRAGDTDVEIPGSIVRSWLESEPGDDGLEIALDDDEVLADLARLLEDVEREPEDASFTVTGGKPAIVRGVIGQACCAPDAVGFILAALKAGHEGEVRLPLTEIDPDQTSADLEELGIVEEIGSFTTRHSCCENRVSNIHRIADLVRGVVIKPGGSFSVNEFVGKRTTENGFIVDHAIENGMFVESVGGGISQFATTTFNASFFAGLDLLEYQSHSIYISRYPYGREATLSYPKPDLVIGNSTPHGVLIWPTYTDTSLTITLYSTKYAHGEQTAQSEAPVGVAGCKRVTTTRTRTYVGGDTKVDKVYAVYRPAEGVQCNGPAPTTTTTTTTTAPPSG